MRRPLRTWAQGVGGDPAPPSIPAPHFELRGQDAVFAAGLLTSWPAVYGPTVNPATAHNASDAGPLANGQQGVLFPTPGARLYSLSAIRAGNFNECSLVLTYNADDAAGAGDREYLLYIWNQLSGSAFHWVAPIQVNVIPFENLGMYAGSGGVGNWIEVAAADCISGLQTVAYTLEASGLLSVYRNGVLLGTAMGAAPATTIWTAPVVGASYEVDPNDAAISQWFKGTLYHLRLWVGIVFDADDVATLSDDDVVEYGVSTPPWFPTDVASLKLYCDSRGKRSAGGAGVFNGATLGLWGDNSTNNKPPQAGAGVEPADGGQTRRIGGYPVVHFDGTNDFMSPGQLSDFTTASAYEYFVVVTVDAVTATSANGYSQQAILADSGGFFWCSLRNNAGVITLQAGHWASSEASASVNVTALIGSPMVVHAWYDGTTIRLQVNAGGIATATHGNIGTSSGAFRLGRSSNTLYTPMSIAELFMFNAALSGANRTAAQSFLATKYGIPVG